MTSCFNCTTIEVVHRTFLVLLLAGGVFAQTPAEWKDRPIVSQDNPSRVMLGDGTVRVASALDPLAKAKAEVERLQGLVDAGVLPKAALDKAERELSDAQDEATLKETLYGTLGIEELTGEQADAMMAAAERQLQRQQDKVEAAKKLIEEGVAARTTLTPFLEDLDAKRKTFDLAASRARLLTELAELAKAEEAAEIAPEEPQGPVKIAERYDGDGVFTSNHFKRIQAAFVQKFSRNLPVSANGTTALHRSMGFDHRGRVDVALNPDQPEGAWLIATLKNERIPYFAFRAAIRGKATGPHIHVGPPSTRYKAAD